VNDRLPYADVSIAAVLVVVGIALAAYPWVGGTAAFSSAALVGAVLAIFATMSPRRTKQVTSGEIPWT
jgi:hypothetical protein